MSEERTPADRNAALVSAVLLFAFAFASSLVPPPFGAPKLAFFAAMAFYAAIVAIVPPLRRSAGDWLRVGALDGRTLVATAALSALSTMALLVYTVALRPDASDLRAQLPVKLAAGVLIALGAGLALVNALTEELAYRGVLQHALEREVGAGPLALLAQGLAFAAPHYAHGYPRGPIGVALCAIYGVLLGVLRRRAAGLLAPTLAHFTADLTIFAVVISME